jgi:hypothetical protein
MSSLEWQIKISNKGQKKNKMPTFTAKLSAKSF